MKKAPPKIYEPGALIWLVDKNKKFPGVIKSRDCLLTYGIEIAVVGVGGTVVRQRVPNVPGSRLEERVP